MSERTPLLVLGLGNVLLEDDGVGAAAVSLLLERYKVPPGVQVLDGGTLGLSLLPYLNAADAVILIDAVRAEGPPGSLVRVEGNEVAPAVATRLSPHQVASPSPDAGSPRGSFVLEGLHLFRSLRPRDRDAHSGLGRVQATLRLVL